jgi:ribosomal protein S18 acetylase RimI-like enzyme
VRPCIGVTKPLGEPDETSSLECRAVIRLAVASDVANVARIHADSWRRHYRGAYSDRYLDGDLDLDRSKVWSERITHSGDRRFTLVAEHRQSLIGFAHAVLDADPLWGSLVDNLHVRRQEQGRGVGTRLLAETARLVLERRPRSAMHLWVLAQNTAAQAFYRARGGVLGDREFAQPPRGDPLNLAGRPLRMRVAWRDPSALLS